MTVIKNTLHSEKIIVYLFGIVFYSEASKTIIKTFIKTNLPFCNVPFPFLGSNNGDSEICKHYSNWCSTHFSKRIYCSWHNNSTLHSHSAPSYRNTKGKLSNK